MTRAVRRVNTGSRVPYFELFFKIISVILKNKPLYHRLYYRAVNPPSPLGLREYASKYLLELEEAYALCEKNRADDPSLEPHTLRDAPPDLGGLSVFVTQSRALEVGRFTGWQLEEALLGGGITPYRRAPLPGGGRGHLPAKASDLSERYFDLNEVRALKARLRPGQPRIPVAALTPQILAKVSEKRFSSLLGVSLTRFATLQAYLEEDAPPLENVSPAQALIFTLYSEHHPGVDPEIMLGGTFTSPGEALSAISKTLSALTHAPKTVQAALPRALKHKLEHNIELHVQVLENFLTRTYGSVSEAERILQIPLPKLHRLYTLLGRELGTTHAESRVAQILTATLELWQAQSALYRALGKKHALSGGELRFYSDQIEELLLRQNRFQLPFEPPLARDPKS